RLTDSVPLGPAAVPLGGFADTAVEVGVPMEYGTAAEVDGVKAGGSAGVNFAVNEGLPTAGVGLKGATPVAWVDVPGTQAGAACARGPGVGGGWGLAGGVSVGPGAGGRGGRGDGGLGVSGPGGGNPPAGSPAAVLTWTSTRK